MQTSGEEARHQEVDEWLPSEEVDEEVVERQDSGDVDKVPSGGALGADESRSQSIEEDLERPACQAWQSMKHS